jgi:Mg/Co/Ni transporter MgtE
LWDSARNQTMALVIRSPARGARVLVTFITDGMGFFLFLFLARVFLV